MGSVGFLLYLLLVSCVFMLVSIDRTPMETCLQMSRLLISERQWTLTFAKPAVNLRRVSQRKEPSNADMPLISECF